MFHVTTRHGFTRYTLSGLSVLEFVDREIAMRDIESFGPLQVGLMSHVSEDRKKRRMTRSWSDYLLCQLAADRQLSTFESLPAEILEPIFEEVNTISISGVRALACTSRTCRALASPYFFKPLKCEFKELQTGDGQQNPPVVLLSAADNFKTLQFHVVPPPRGHQLMTITQVLSVEDTYECLEYLPDRCGSLADQFNLSAPALDLFSRTLPMLSRLVLDLGYFIGYSTSWDHAYKKATEKLTRNYLPYIDGLDIIHAIARFQTLRCLTLRYKLVRDQIALMHPNPGCEVVHEMFESIQRRKRGQSLVRFEVVFYTNSTMIFGRIYKTCTVSTTMKIVCNNDTFSSQGGEQSQCNFTCDNPRYGKAIERRKRIERLYGELAWTKSFGTIQHNLLHGRYRTLPRRIVMESLLRLALLPSYFVFEEGKRVQFEPSLANVEV